MLQDYPQYYKYLIIIIIFPISKRNIFVSEKSHKHWTWSQCPLQTRLETVLGTITATFLQTLVGTWEQLWNGRIGTDIHEIGKFFTWTGFLVQTSLETGTSFGTWEQLWRGLLSIVLKQKRICHLNWFLVADLPGNRNLFGHLLAALKLYNEKCSWNFRIKYLDRLLIAHFLINRNLKTLYWIYFFIWG